MVSMVENSGGPNWKNLTLPPGRTQKACTHAWTRMKAEAAKAPWYNGGVKQVGGDGEIQKGAEGPAQGKKRPTKDAEAGPKKRTKNEGGKSIKAEDEEMG